MNKKAHSNPKSNAWLIYFAIMLVISAGVVFGSSAIAKAAKEADNKPVAVDFTIASTTPMSVAENELGITGVEKAFDGANNVVAYVIKQQAVGYNQESPIEMATTITADGKIVCGIEIISQEETEYLGVRIMEDSFTNQFKGRQLPLKGAGSILKGSEVDLIARSTVSSQAVVDAVNNAQEYVTANLAE